MSSFKIIGLPVLEKVFKGFYHISRPLISVSTTPCCVKENVQEISGGSAGDSKIEDHGGRCLGLKGINSFPS